MIEDKKKCVKIEHPNIMSGYGCCQCKTYNSNINIYCRYCNHKRCDIEIDPTLN